MRKPAVRYLLSAVLVLVCLFLAFRGTDPALLWASMLHASYGWICVSFLALLVSHMVRAVRWRFLLNPIRPKIPFRSLFSGVMVGYMMNNVIPRAGELARPYALARREHLSGTAAFGTIVVERVIDVLTFLLLTALLPVLYHGPLTETFPWLVPTGIIVSGLILALLAGMILLMLRRSWVDLLFGLTAKVLPARWAASLGRGAHAFLDGLLFVTRPADCVVIVLLSGAIWGLYAVMTWIAFWGFDAMVHLDFAAAVVLMTISSVGVALPTPGGMGSYHALMAKALTELFGVDGATALSYATLTHGIGYIGVTVIGLWYMWRDHLGVREVAQVKEVQP